MTHSAAFADESIINPERAKEALKSASSDTREKAAEYLGDIRYNKATDALIATLNDVEDDVREEAVRSLGKIGDNSKKTVDALIYQLGDGAGGVRCAAAEALAKIGDPKAIEPIRKQRAAEGNPINQVRMQRAIDQIYEKQPPTK